MNLGRNRQACDRLDGRTDDASGGGRHHRYRQRFSAFQQERSERVIAIACAALALIGPQVVYPGNVDPGDSGARYAWAENAGWLNLAPADGSGAQVGDTTVTGYAWAENVGWINLSCANSSTCAQVAFGVTNNRLGALSGYAWSENAGWISFSCLNTASCLQSNYGVSIDPLTGVFSGRAWAENIGWISFDSSANHPGVVTSWRATDTDGDGVLDPNDNCTPVANPTQLDADGDGYGNICDADLNNSGLTTSTDFGLLRSVLNQTAGSSALAAAADMNGSGLVTSSDFNLLRARLNTAPGPSGLHP